MSTFARAVAPLVDGFITYYLDRGQKSESVGFKHQIPYLVRFISSQRRNIDCVSAIGRRDIEGFIEYLWNVEYGGHYGAHTNRNNFVYRALRAAHKFFEYLTVHAADIEEKHLPAADLVRKGDFPSPNRKGTKHFPRWFDKLLLAEIRALPEGTFGQLRFKTMVFVLYYVGARIRDVCTVERSCLITKHGVPWMRVFSNKTKFYYEVPISLELKQRLEKYREATEGFVGQHPTTGKATVFLFWKADRATIDSFTQRAARKVKDVCSRSIEVAKEKGLPVRDVATLSLTSHKFRHTVAIRLIRLGADPMLVAEFLGHTDLSMAQAYIQESQQEIDELMAELYDDDSLGLSEVLDGGSGHTREDLFEYPGIISKVECGHCAHVDGKPPCGEDAYDCWLCEKLQPDGDDPDYLDRLGEHLVAHQELYERNVRLGHLGAARAEEKVIQRIQSFMDEVSVQGARGGLVFSRGESA